MKNMFQLYNIEYGSSQTYDHCYPSHELHKDEKSYCRYCFQEKQCIRTLDMHVMTVVNSCQ